MVQNKGFWVLLAAGAAKLVRWVTGPSQVSLDTTVENHVSSLTAVSVHGYEVTINCKAVYFKRQYRRFFMPSRRMAVYSISTVVPPDAPERLHEVATPFNVNMPRDSVYLHDETRQKQRAIEAYLDLLLAKLNRRDAVRLEW
jgi:hypothetical protein